MKSDHAGPIRRGILGRALAEINPPHNNGQAFRCDCPGVVWTIDEIVEQNAFFRAEADKRAYDRDFRDLVFFANAGCDGILFGFLVTEERVCAPDVVVWHPFEDELTEIAPSLEEFLKGWLTSSISV